MCPEPSSLVTTMIATARGCLGTPFHHQGRHATAGLDCIGLIILAARSIGITIKDRTDYGLRPDGESLINGLRDHGCMAIGHDDTEKPGDIALFRFDGNPQHVALITECTKGIVHMIHSFAPAGKVVEVVLKDPWRRRLLGVYRFPFSME